jgi:hypothetical protein
LAIGAPQPEHVFDRPGFFVPQNLHVHSNSTYPMVSCGMLALLLEVMSSAAWAVEVAAAHQRAYNDMSWPRP